jgi:predicted nucleic acid-binding protein
MIIDTNILLRLILDDDPDLTRQAREIYKNATHESLEVLSMSIAEIVYILRSLGYERVGISNAIIVLMYTDAFLFDRLALEPALNIFAQTKLDFVDCYLVADAISHGKELKTFDKKMRREYDRLKSKKNLGHLL